MVYVIIGQDKKAAWASDATAAARMFREAWDTLTLRNAVAALAPGDQLMVDGATVICLTGDVNTFL